MAGNELLKVGLTFCLLFFICFCSMIGNSKKVNEISKPDENGDYKGWTYPFYDKSCDCVNFYVEESNQYKDPWNWAIFFANDKFMIVVAFLIIAIRPDFTKFGFDLTIIWVVYFVMLLFDRVLFLEKWQWRPNIEIFMVSLQFLYLSYCAALHYKWLTDNNR